MKLPVFSIIIATYKRPQLLTRAINSVVSQTFRDFECIVVDDDGDIGTAQIVQQFEDRRIVLIQHASNRGTAAAYNSGIKASRGSLISILDDDDEYYPTFLEKMHHFFQTAPSRIGFAWTGIQIVRDAPEGEMLWYKRVWPDEFQNREAAYIAATTIGNGFGLTMRKESIDIVGPYSETYKVCVDTEHLFRLARRFDFATIPEILVKIHHHEDTQLTHQSKDKLRLEMHEKILIENLDFIAHFPELYYVHYRRLVEICYSLEMDQKGRQILLELWKKIPCRLSIPMDLICYKVYGMDFKTVLNNSKMRKLLKKILQ